MFLGKMSVPTGVSNRESVYSRTRFQLRNGWNSTNAKKYNGERGGRDLIEDGMLKVLLGQTTVDEIYRVCG